MKNRHGLPNQMIILYCEGDKKQEKPFSFPLTQNHSVAIDPKWATSNQGTKTTKERNTEEGKQPVDGD